MSIAAYANQTVTWKQITGRNAAGQPTYSSTAIKGRFEEDRKLVRDGQGDEVVSEALLITASAVTVGDAIVDPSGRTWKIITVAVRNGLDGRELFREARL